MLLRELPAQAAPPSHPSSIVSIPTALTHPPSTTRPPRPPAPSLCSLHGGKDQSDRESTIADFKANVCNILTATSGRHCAAAT